MLYITIYTYACIIISIPETLKLFLGMTLSMLSSQTCVDISLDALGKLDPTSAEIVGALVETINQQAGTRLLDIHSSVRLDFKKSYAYLDSDEFQRAAWLCPGCDFSMQDQRTTIASLCPLCGIQGRLILELTESSQVGFGSHILDVLPAI